MKLKIKNSSQFKKLNHEKIPIFEHVLALQFTGLSINFIKKIKFKTPNKLGLIY